MSCGSVDENDEFGWDFKGKPPAAYVPWVNPDLVNGLKEFSPLKTLIVSAPAQGVFLSVGDESASASH